MFIQLSRSTDDESILVNTNHILVIEDNEEESTIFLSCNIYPTSNRLSVKESKNDILKMISKDNND